MKFVFNYNKNVKFETKVELYISSLGSPILLENKASWEDLQTQFIIYKDEKNIVSAALFDKKVKK